MTLIPYIAIIKDSFREAISSRVLWILLSLITLTHLTFFPLTFLEVQTIGLRYDNVTNWPGLIEEVVRDRNTSSPSPSKHLWSLLSEETRAKMLELKEPKAGSVSEMRSFLGKTREIHGEIAGLIVSDKFYDKAAFSDIAPSIEVLKLRQTEYAKLAANDRQRLNRVAFEGAYPEFVEASSPTSLQLKYFAWDILVPLPVSKSELTQGVLTYLPYLIDKGLLSIGLLVAILVTASIIPQTFEPGSLHLLLSKPISRSLLYLTKFAGGCAFILVSSAYLFLGLWMIFGTRLGIWEHRLLWCIPLYTFVFAVYYSVAALAGLIWRNTIVSIAVVILFWATCFCVGISKDSMLSVISKNRIQKLTEVDGKLMAVDVMNFPAVFDKENNRWKLAMLSKEQEDTRAVVMLLPVPRPSPVLGPVYDPNKQRLILGTTTFRAQGRIVLGEGDPAQSFLYKPGPVAPVNSLALLPTIEGTPLLVSSFGLFEVEGELSEKGNKPLKLLGFTVPLSERGPLREVSPAVSPSWEKPASAAIDEASDELAIYSRGRVIRLERGTARYEVSQEISLEGEPRQVGRLDIAKSGILVGRADGTLYWLDRETLEERQQFAPEGKNQPRLITASPDGNTFAILFEHDKLWLFDAPSATMKRAKVRGQGDISTATFTERGTLLVADRTTRVTEYDLATMKVVASYAPPLEMMEFTYRYVLMPIYTLCPKPGEFYKTVQYLLTEQATQKQGEDEEAAQEPLHPWRPVTSSALFMAVMLAIGCLYIHRQEF